MATITLTDEQEEIIGYAIWMALRNQKAKLDDCRVIRDGEVIDRSFVLTVDGYRERITRLEEVYDMFSVGSD